MRARSLPIFFGFLLAGTVHCAGGLCPEMSGGAASAHFTDDGKANAELRAFVGAAGDLAEIADKVEAETADACLAMGHDLGLSDSDMKATSGPGGKAEGACRALTVKIDAILKEGGSASLRASVTPPQCHAEASAEASCAGECKVEVDPGYVVAHCSPAELSGECDGTCGGHCEGTCNGECSGGCTAKDASGKCIGKCAGECHGTCEATCHAKCEGTWKAPVCKTEVKPPSASASCQASCKAHAELKAECTPAHVEVAAAVKTGEMGKLVETLQAHLPKLIEVEVVYGKRLATAIATLAKVGAELPSVVGNAGAKAAACVGAAAQATVHAQAQIHVSVEASASVSGKAHAG